MSFLSRVAALAAITLSLAGVSQSAPGLAAELDRTAIAAAAPALPGTDAGLINAAAMTAPESLPTTTPAVMTDGDTAVDTATPDKFTSLADAVAAQDIAAADDNLRCLASAIYFESKGEPVAGQLAVAEVIINRARSGRFPPDVCGVITQRGQFSFVRGGVIPAVDAARPGYRTALAVAKVAMADLWDSNASGALFFHARGSAPGGRFTRVAAIGNHIFYR